MYFLRRSQKFQPIRKYNCHGSHVEIRNKNKSQIIPHKKHFCHIRFIYKSNMKGVHVEQELLIFLEHLNSPLVFCGVRVVRSLVFLCSDLQIVVCSFVPFTFGHCVVCPSSIYSFLLPLWYFLMLLSTNVENVYVL